MTLPSRHSIRNSNPDGLRLPIILNLYERAGKKYFVSLLLERQSGVRTRDLRLSEQTALATAPGPPPHPWILLRRCPSVRAHLLCQVLYTHTVFRHRWGPENTNLEVVCLIRQV